MHERCHLETPESIRNAQKGNIEAIGAKEMICRHLLSIEKKNGFKVLCNLKFLTDNEGCRAGVLLQVLLIHDVRLRPQSRAPYLASLSEPSRIFDFTFLSLITRFSHPLHVIRHPPVHLPAPSDSNHTP